MFHDWRWNDVVTMRVVELPAGSSVPGFGDGPGTDRERAGMIAEIHRVFPGAPVDFVRGGTAADRGEAYRFTHELLAEHDRQGGGGFLICDLGGFAAVANPHAFGDFTTYRSALAGLMSRITGAEAPDVPSMSPSRCPMPAIVRAAAERGVREPRAMVTAVRDVLADQRAGDAPPGDRRTAEARPRYASFTLDWPGDGRRPRAVPLAWDWRMALAGELGPGAVHPRDFWLVVGLRQGSRSLEGLGGNFLARIRMACTGDRESDIAETTARIRSPYAIARTALSAAPQQVRQLLGRAERERTGPGFPTRREVPVDRLAVSLAYNRVDDASPTETTAVLVGPGVVSANAYEGTERTVYTVSAFVDDATWDGIVRATRGTLEAVGYRIVDEP
ncbi:hypothetical protein [Corynebacterium sp. 335C]